MTLPSKHEPSSAVRELDAPRLLERLRPHLLDLMTQTGAPAASVGLLSPSGIDVLYAGVTDLQSHSPVTDGTLFEIGSITKVWTASAIMRLIDRGLLSLDTPVHDVVPELPDTGSTMRVRQLLSHTGGLIDQPFDMHEDSTNREVVAELASGAIGSPGEFAYSNVGYVVLGRVLEEVTGQTLPEALQAEVLDPVGVDDVRILPPSGPRARGHQPNGTGGLREERPGRFPGYAACGSTPAATARALLRTVHPHLHEGLAADGTRVLTPQAVREMQGCHAEVPTNAERKAPAGAWAGCIISSRTGAPCSATAAAPSASCPT